jgi:hypothetical protein
MEEEKLREEIYNLKNIIDQVTFTHKNLERALNNHEEKTLSLNTEF